MCATAAVQCTDIAAGYMIPRESVELAMKMVSLVIEDPAKKRTLQRMCVTTAVQCTDIVAGYMIPPLAVELAMKMVWLDGNCTSSTATGRLSSCVPISLHLLFQI